MNKNGGPALFILLLFTVQLLCAQIQKSGFTGTAVAGDSLVLQPRHLILGAPASRSLGIELEAPSSFNKKAVYFNPRAQLPQNSLLLDTRGSSYYVPRQVGDQLAHIMNRPSSNEVAPVFMAAALAVSIAMQYIDMGNELKLKADDYLIDTTYFPILKALYSQSSQTAFQLYENADIKRERTVVLLQKELSTLVDLNLVKVKTQEKAPPLYFAAQEKETVYQLLSEALKREELSNEKKQKLRTFVQLVDLLR